MRLDLLQSDVDVLRHRILLQLKLLYKVSILFLAISDLLLLLNSLDQSLLPKFFLTISSPIRRLQGIGSATSLLEFSVSRRRVLQSCVPELREHARQIPRRALYRGQQLRALLSLRIGRGCNVKVRGGHREIRRFRGALLVAPSSRFQGSYRGILEVVPAATLGQPGVTLLLTDGRGLLGLGAASILSE